MLQSAPDAERLGALVQIAQACQTVTVARAPYRRLGWDELAQLSRHPLAEIGAHTVSHPKLSVCTPERQRFEMAQSKADLEERLGRTISSLAYPYGGSEHINAASVELARETGYARACTTSGGRIFEQTDRFALPRVFVPDCDGDAFDRILTNAFSGIS